MTLGLILLFLLLLALGLVQAWTIWFLRRQIARLDQRLEESLDDQDLLDFQERLQTLLDQAKATVGDMLRSVQERQTALEKSLALVREAEKQLLARTQVLSKAADAAAERAEKLLAQEGGRKFSRPPQKAPTKRSRPPQEAARAAPTPPEQEKPEADGSKAAEDERAPAASPSPTGSSRHQRIYDLADRGLNREQIAKETGLLPGEVELILNLRPRRR
jgi:hypothetical protein